MEPIIVLLLLVKGEIVLDNSKNVCKMELCIPD